MVEMELNGRFDVNRGVERHHAKIGPNFRGGSDPPSPSNCVLTALTLKSITPKSSTSLTSTSASHSSIPAWGPSLEQISALL